MKITGTLPLQGRADLELDETLFGMMADAIGPMHTIDVIFSYPNLSNETKKKVRITLTEVLKPGTVRDAMKKINDSIIDAVVDKYSIDAAMNRSMDYLYRELVFKSSWILLGHLETRPHRTLCIIYSTIVRCGSYTFKQDDPRLN